MTSNARNATTTRQASTWARDITAADLAAGLAVLAAWVLLLAGAL